MAAVMMSQQLLARAAVDHAQVAVLARTIRDDQHAEIFQMRRWLRTWYGTGWHRGWGGRHQGWAGMGSGMGSGMGW